MVQFPPTVMVAYAANCEPRTAALSPHYCQTGGVWDPLDPLYKRPPHGGIVTTESFLTVWDWTIMTSLGTASFSRVYCCQSLQSSYIPAYP
jgi:hypothetical protein